MKQMLGIYARQSREKATSGSIEDQILQGKAKARDLEMDFELYVDRDESAFYDNLDNRPEFLRLLNDIKAQKIMVVFAQDSARLTRNDEIGFYIKSIFKKHKIIVYTILDGTIDYSDSSSVFYNDLKTLFNMKFVVDTSLKIKSVLKKNAEQGRAHSGAIKPFGYTSDDKKMLIIDQEEAEVVREIYTLYLNGYGSGKIAKVLNERGIETKTHRLINQNRIGQNEESSFNEQNRIGFKKWAPNVVLNILKNSLYKGCRLHKQEYFDAPKIIDDFTWQRVQEQMQKNLNSPGLNKHSYLLKDLCYCGRCGSTFNGRTRPNKRDHVYRCASKINSDKKCGIRSINIDTLESVVWLMVSTSEIIIDKAKEEVNKLKEPTHIEHLKKEKLIIDNKIRSINKTKVQIFSWLKSELITNEDAEKELTSIKESLKTLTSTLSEINAKLETDLLMSQRIDDIKEFMQQWNNLVFSENFELQYNIVRLFVEKIIIDFDDVEETYTVNVFAKLPEYSEIQTFYLNTKGELQERMNVNNVDSSKITVSPNSSMKKPLTREVRLSGFSSTPPKTTSQHR